MKKVVNVKRNCTGMFNSEIIDAIFESRGVIDREKFMNPTEENLLSLDSLYRVDEAADTIIDGMTNNKKFLVWGDTDTDGCCSCAIIVRYLKDMGCDVEWGIPKGKAHGTDFALFKKIESIKPDILIIVDSLDSDIENYQNIYERGIKTIVLDHHDIDPKLEEKYDKYTILVSSNRKYANKDLSGAGVTFKTCLYIDSLLGTMGADKFYDLCCTGLIADMMDMSEASMENRYLVSKGLSNIQNPALKKIGGGFGFDSKTVSFSIAPLVNASCRYNENEAAVMALLADDNKDVLKYMKVLKNCKEKQSEEVDKILPELIQDANEQLDKKMICVVVETDGGITGLLANKLLEIYQRPILVLKEGFNSYSGSMRSIGCGDFRSICEQTRLCSANGHPEASGIEILYSNFEAFRNEIDEALSEVEFESTTDVDLELDLGDINDELINEIKKIDRITGQNFKPIKVKVTCDNFEPTTMSQGKHLVLNVGTFGRFQFIKWNAGDLLEEFEDHAMFCDEISFIGSLDAGFLGRNYSMKMIVDNYIVED